MNIEAFELTLEQQFALKLIEDEAGVASKEQLEQQLLEAMQLMMRKDNIIKHLTKEALKNGNSL